ncbi:hypothetical protein Ancab_025202 [Ancistrocladus abbreviatus]
MGLQGLRSPSVQLYNSAAVCLGNPMGSHMKKSVFDEQTANALRKWHKAAKKKGEQAGKSPNQTIEGISRDSTVHSSGRSLHRFKTTGHSTRSFAFEEHETSAFEPNDQTSSPKSPAANLIVRVDHGANLETEMVAQPLMEEVRQEDDLSFS